MFKRGKKESELEAATNREPAEAPESKKRAIRVPKIVRNIFISAFILLFLFIGGALAYTYLSGSGELPPEQSAIVATEPGKEIKPAKPSPNAPASASVQFITSPVKAGSNATLSVRTVPTSTCKVLVEYNKVASKDSGLVAKDSDAYGIVSWTWTVGAATPVGKWPVAATCVYNKKSAVVQTEIVVER